MPTVQNLRETCRDTVPCETADPFPFECKSAPGGLVRLQVQNGSEWAAGVYQNWYALTLEVDAARWLPIFEAAAAKCREAIDAALTPAERGQAGPT